MTAEAGPGLGPGALRELGRLTDQWVRFHEGAFGDVEQAEWAKLRQATGAEQTESLWSLVQAVETRLKELDRLARSARRTVRKIGQRLGAARK